MPDRKTEPDAASAPAVDAGTGTLPAIPPAAGMPQSIDNDAAMMPLRGGAHGVDAARQQVLFDLHLVSDSSGETVNTVARAVLAQFDGVDATAYLVPGHFHGWAGLLGLALMLNLWRMGRKTRNQKAEGQSFARSKEMHGKISDLMMTLVFIHAFLGFLYLLAIL